jgi:hypothetical protein
MLATPLSLGPPPLLSANDLSTARVLPPSFPPSLLTHTARVRLSKRIKDSLSRKGICSIRDQQARLPISHTSFMRILRVG